MSYASAETYPIEYSIPLACQVVSNSLGRDIPRTTFYRWRKTMGWIGSDYEYLCPDAVKLLVFFGRCRCAGYSLKFSKAKTLSYLESLKNV